MPTQETMIGTLQLLTYVRNICAHHGQLWNRRTVKRLPNIKRFRGDLQLSEDASDAQNQLSNRINNVLVILALLMRHQATDTTFPVRVRGLVETIDNEERGSMGFSADWRARPVWVDVG